MYQERAGVAHGSRAVASCTPHNKPLQTDQQQLASIDLVCHLAAY
jgi:hypothetical protein